MNDDVLKVFSGRLAAADETGKEVICLVNDLRIHAHSSAKAQEAMMDEFWDPRLETTGCSPRCTIEELTAAAEPDLTDEFGATAVASF